MIVVGVYVLVGTEYNRLDLFKDETISITSTIQDANDISKTFTDFSESFTIPANENNNKIFSYWYENSIDSGYDARIRKSAYVTLDTKVFRTGKIQLEKVDLKNDLPQSYTITFFGALVSLKDTFNGLYLSNLDSGTFDFAYSPTAVTTKVTTQTTDSIKFPLITSNRVWNWNGSDTANNISNTGGTAIATSELFPALRVKNILDLIATKFNITFSGTFITSNERFLKAYMWLKNTDIFTTKGQVLQIDYQSKSGSSPYMVFSTVTDDLTINAIPAIYTQAQRIVTLNITNVTAGVQYYVYVYKNGISIGSFLNTSIIGTQSIVVLQVLGNAGNSSDKYTFRISSITPLTFLSTATLDVYYEDSLGTPFSFIQTITQSTSQTTANIIQISNYMPFMKIEDFFSGILKMFNLVCYSNTAGNYIIEQLETYYTQGNIIDISKYIISDTKGIERIKPYNKVNFEHEKSTSFTNVNFLGLYGREYGDLQQSYNADGGEYSIKVPFETMLFSQLTTNLQVGYSLKNDLKPYIPKPLIIYDYGVLQTVSAFKFNTGSYTTYNAFGSETNISSVDYSLNFGAEQSSLKNTIVSNSLYSQFYQNYLLNLYSDKSRIIKVSAILPSSFLTSNSTTGIKLNTRLIIKGKRYIINSFNTNLITGVVEFDLVNDFRDAV